MTKKGIGLIKKKGRKRGARPKADQVVVNKLREILIKPLLRFRPSQISLGDFMDGLFGYPDRQINKYQVRESFRMPGILVRESSDRIQGLGHRQVNKDQHILAREDIHRPNQIEVSYFGGPGAKEITIELDQSQWNWVRTKLEKED